MAVYYGDAKSKTREEESQLTLPQMFDRLPVPRTLDVSGRGAGELPPGDASSRLRAAQRGSKRSSGDVAGDSD